MQFFQYFLCIVIVKFKVNIYLLVKCSSSNFTTASDFVSNSFNLDYRIDLLPIKGTRFRHYFAFFVFLNTCPQIVFWLKNFARKKTSILWWSTKPRQFLIYFYYAWSNFFDYIPNKWNDETRGRRSQGNYSKMATWKFDFWRL